MNRILKRQLKHHFSKDFDISSLEPRVQELLKNVEETYEEFNSERKLLENTIEINSTELYEANKQIRQKNDNLGKLLDDNSKLLANRVEENLEIGTKLKQYKQAMDSALLVITFDLNNKITFANENFCQLSAYASHELIGKEYDFILQGDQEALSLKILSTIQNNYIWHGLIKYKSRDSNLYNLNTTIFPILNAHDEILEYMSIFQDITAIETSRQKAIELDKAKSLFIANMSHELRTPLNSIIGFSQILIYQDQMPDKLRNYIEKINFSGEHLLKLINSILDFSKIEAGQVVLENIEIDLYSIISSILVQQEVVAKHKGIALNIEYEESLGKSFLGDSLRLTQIITNLVSNALKFTDEGSITAIVHKIKNNQVRIEIKDTGIGLSTIDKDKLFKEFSQADSSTSREYGGTGLGLSISKELVELMDGKIWVESQKGKGSSFIFEINLEELDKTKPNLHQDLKTDITTLQDLDAIEEKTILLVEDNTTNQFLISSLLEGSKIKMQIANHGLEALNMINHRKKPYDLILMDLQMPIMNGFEVTIEIRRDDKTTPIIALSANILKKDIEKTKVIGMNKYLTKPINTNKFYSCLIKYLG